ncbi:hypothetical protein [Nostoc sp.]|uniref:hypothetical protein n=1 Tax=Nostoc sp. TaxID=1180 RepID=UPI002FF91E9F
MSISAGSLEIYPNYQVDWASRAISHLGGYLEHRKNSAIGIQVLWRGWLELETLCQGWLLHQNLK